MCFDVFSPEMGCGAFDIGLNTLNFWNMCMDLKFDFLSDFLLFYIII